MAAILLRGKTVNRWQEEDDYMRKTLDIPLHLYSAFWHRITLPSYWLLLLTRR